MTCPSCGATIDVTAGGSCPACGAPLPAAGAQQPSSAAAASPAGGPAEQPSSPAEQAPPSAGYAAPAPSGEALAGPAAPRATRDLAMWTHLSAFIGLLGIPSPAGPLVIWLLKRESHPFVDDQGKEALNFNISALIYALAIFFAGFVFTVVTLGLGMLLLFPLLLAVIVAWIVLVIIAAVRSSKGESYRYPLTIRFVS